MILDGCPIILCFCYNFFVADICQNFPKLHLAYASMIRVSSFFKTNRTNEKYLFKFGNK